MDAQGNFFVNRTTGVYTFSNDGRFLGYMSGTPATVLDMAVLPSGKLLALDDNRGELLLLWLFAF